MLNNECQTGGLKIIKPISANASKSPLVTVITIVLNNKTELEKTIESVCEQTYENLEYVVIDGGSTDGTISCIRRHEIHINYWLSEPDRGISDAFNKGLKFASGEWILFLNAGDCFLGKDAVEIFSKHFSDANRIVTAFAKTEKGIMPQRILANDEDFRIKSMISHQASMVHREVYANVGWYNHFYKIRMDYEFWLRALKRYEFIFLDKILIDYAPNGVSARNIKQYYLEEHRANMKHCKNSRQFFGALWRYLNLLLK